MKPTRSSTAARLLAVPERVARDKPFRAEVVDVVDPDTVIVRAPALLRAEIAVIGYVPAVGDVVVVEEGEGACFVIGALGEARRRRAPDDAGALAGGALIATVSDAGGVELRAREGDLTLSAPGRVVVRAGDVQIEAAGAASIQAAEITSTATEIVTQAGRVEVHAARIVEAAGDTYRRVDGLAELQAGRARTLVEGACQIVSKRTTITSDEDTIVDGKRVLLG